MPELGKAYVQIIPSAEGISGSIESTLAPEAQSAGSKIGASLGGSIGTAIKGSAALITGAAVGVTGAVVKGSADLASYGDNIDKMSQKMGISAQGYQEWEAVMQHSGTSMETMKASMKTLANAVENGNDSFERIGISLEDLGNMSNEDIFNATIAGLQNVDNETERTYLAGQLLGRGATELGALLNTSAEDTQAMKDRVHELGGVMSDEAVKNAAAFQDNLQDLQTAFAGVGRGIFAELLPGMNEIMAGFTSLIAGEEGASEAISNGFNSLFDSLTDITSNIVSTISDMLPGMVEGFATILPEVITMAADLIISIGQAIIDALPTIITVVLPALAQAAIEIVIALGRALVEAAPQLVSAGQQLISTLKTSINPSELLSKGQDMITSVLNGITNALPGLLQSGVQIILNIANGILQNLPQLITTAYQLITQFTAFLLQNLPTILQAGADLLLGLVNGIISNLPEIVIAAVQGVTQFITTIAGMLPQVLQQGIEIIFKLIAGLVQAIPDLIAAIPQIISAIVDTIMEVDWLQLGLDILDGIAKGITNGVSNLISALWGAVSDAIQWVKDQLGIKSPSKLMADVIGKNMALGIGVGFEDNMPDVDMADAVLDTTGSMETAVQSGVVNSADRIDYMAIYEAVKAGAEAANLIIDLDGREVTRTLKGLGVAMA